MFLIGLTGGVASGKTTVSKIWNKEGAYLIDADQIARDLVQPKRQAWYELINIFGKEILQEDGSIHRKRLAKRIFSESRERETLNKILHPLIKSEMDRRIKEIGRNDPTAIIVIDAPLLIELGIHKEMDILVVVTSKEDQQIERLKERDGLDEEEARKIISCQMPMEEKVRVADFVINNEGSLEEIKKKAEEIFEKIKIIALKDKKIDKNMERRGG